ncbi:Uncharacterised protein [Legionella beliardensis]|uniref:Uncharacterized protein n=1 Tax=Legionella beliardensis TaxID=91822 RepID=A0A378I943_9GAMM|nr:hypothetical protein [Legionella beliardensis]STX28894.1 Uncharacterised protein [Legionella beliardensis]
MKKLFEKTPATAHIAVSDMHDILQPDNTQEITFEPQNQEIKPESPAEQKLSLNSRKRTNLAVEKKDNKEENPLDAKRKKEATLEPRKEKEVEPDEDDEKSVAENYFYEREAGLRDISFIVLNEIGIVIGASSKLEDKNEPFLVSKNGIIPSEDGSTHAYIVINAQLRNQSNQIANVQVVVMRGFIGKDSSHTFLFQSVVSNAYKLQNVLKKHGITIDSRDYYFSGECQSLLKVSDVQSMIGQPLKGITFNTKGTITDRFKKSDGPELTSYIPKSCLTLHSKHDEHLKLRCSDDGILINKQRSISSSSLSSSLPSDPFSSMPYTFFANEANLSKQPDDSPTEKDNAESTVSTTTKLHYGN